MTVVAVFAYLELTELYATASIRTCKAYHRHHILIIGTLTNKNTPNTLQRFRRATSNSYNETQKETGSPIPDVIIAECFGDPPLGRFCVSAIVHDVHSLSSAPVRVPAHVLLSPCNYWYFNKLNFTSRRRHAQNYG